MSSTTEAPRRTPRRHLIVGGILVAVLAGQTGALIAQQMQISNLKTQPGPAGPSGPPGPVGPVGPRGLMGLAGRDGEDGQDAIPAVEVPADDAPALLTRTEAHAHCQNVADQAYPSSDSGDESLDDITDVFSVTMREKTFKECMGEQGYPQ